MFQDLNLKMKKILMMWPLPSVLAIYCFVIIYYKIEQPETANICYLTVSDGQESGSCLAGWSWRTASPEIPVRMFIGAAVLQRLEWVLLQVGSSTWMEAGLHSSPCGPCRWLLE